MYAFHAQGPDFDPRHHMVHAAPLAVYLETPAHLWVWPLWPSSIALGAMMTPGIGGPKQHRILRHYPGAIDQVG